MLIALDNTSSAPLYQQIVDQVRAMILSGRLEPGDPLPSIRQLAADLVISVITTKRAYQELEAQELIVTQQGRGTFVAGLAPSDRRRLVRADIARGLAELARQAREAQVGLKELTAMLETEWSKHLEDEEDE